MSEVKTDSVVNVSGDNDSGIDLSTNDVVAIKTADTERARVDASGNVGIGTTSPGSLLQVGSTATSNNVITVTSANNSTAGIDLMGDLTGAKGFRVKYEGNGNYFAIEDNTSGSLSERMRLDSSGRVLAGKTSTTYTTDGVMLSNGGNNYSRTSGTVIDVNRNGSDGNVLSFYKAGASVGSISVTGSSTAFNTSSDHRLKENVADMTGAIDRVKALAPKRFNFIADADTTVDGFLAHEAQAVVPEAVTGTHNEVDDDGNPVMQGIDQSKLVPLLTGALKEAIAKIEALEARVAALENP